MLYGLAGTLLAAASIYILIRERRSASARWFVATCASLLGWVTTLYIFQHLSTPGLILLMGRLNFAAASLAVYAVYRLVRAVAERPRHWIDRFLGLIALLFALASSFTPWVDQAEIVSPVAGFHLTHYGWLAPVYLLHIVLMLVAAVFLVLWERKEGHQPRHIRDQLLLLSIGIVSTGTISILTNIIIPYSWGDFTWIDIGPLSTVLLLLAVAYAVVRHQLFDIKVLIRRTLVLGIALSLVLACYSALVLLATDYLASSESGGLTRFGVLVLAFSFDPVRRLLEKSIDRLLFPAEYRSRRRA